MSSQRIMPDSSMRAVAGRGMASGQVEKDVTVAVTEESVILLDGEEVTEEELTTQIAELFPPGTTRERKVIFDGHVKAPYEHVVHVMDVLRQQGIEAINVKGGMVAWTRAGLPIKKGK